MLALPGPWAVKLTGSVCSNQEICDLLASLIELLMEPEAGITFEAGWADRAPAWWEFTDLAPFSLWENAAKTESRRVGWGPFQHTTRKTRKERQGEAKFEESNANTFSVNYYACPCQCGVARWFTRPLWYWYLKSAIMGTYGSVLFFILLSLHSP